MPYTKLYIQESALVTLCICEDVNNTIIFKILNLHTCILSECLAAIRPTSTSCTAPDFFT